MRGSAHIHWFQIYSCIYNFIYISFIPLSCIHIHIFINLHDYFLSINISIYIYLSPIYTYQSFFLLSFMYYLSIIFQSIYKSPISAITLSLYVTYLSIIYLSILSLCSPVKNLQYLCFFLV